ncbi:MAG: hypothetical protein ABIG60_04405 [Patescibacteria group bacterium]
MFEFIENLEFDYKKIGLLTGFILLSAILAYGIYALFFKPAPVVITLPDSGIVDTGGDLPITQVGDGTNIAGPGASGLPTTDVEDTDVGDASSEDVTDVARGGLTKTTILNQSPSSAVTLASNQSELLFYNQNNGKFYRINSGGQINALSDKTFFNVQSVAWSPKSNKAVIEYPDGANIVYDFSTNKQVTLPKHWEEFNFSPNGDQLVSKSIGLDPDNRWLVVTNDDGSEARSIEALGKNADSVHSSWSPNNLSVALFTESIDLDRQRLYFIGQNKENFKATVIEGRGLEHQWAPDGKKLIYSVHSSSSDLKPELWIVDAQGDEIGSNRRKLNLQTWAHKCSLPSSDIIYCAVPETLPEGAGLFPELANNTRDYIYKVNLKTGASNLVAIPDNNSSIDTLIVPPQENKIYFTDTQSGSIHSMRLQ